MRISTTFFLLVLAHVTSAALPRRPVYLGSRTNELDDLSVAPPSLPIPRSPYKQVTREQIVARQQAKRKYGGVVKRQAAQASATVYPSCANTAAGTTIAQTGFANMSPWYIQRTSPYDVTGAWMGVKSALECIALCQQIGSACNGVYYDPTRSTCSRRTSGVPPGNRWSSLTGGTMAVRGTCQQIASAVNNATVMANCCDNIIPSSTVCATTDYQNLGQYCARAGSRLNGNVLSQSNVAAGTARTGYENCTTLCRNTTVSAYSAQTTSTQCLGVMYDNARTINANINCYLQGNNLSSTTTTASSGIVNFINGRCEQQNVGTGTYSAQYRAISGCNTDPQLSF